MSSLIARCILIIVVIGIGLVAILPDISASMGLTSKQIWGLLFVGFAILLVIREMAYEDEDDDEN